MGSSTLKRRAIRSLVIASSAAIVVGLTAAGAAPATLNFVPDVEAPELVTYNIDETEFNLWQGDATFTVTAHVTDETGLDGSPVIIASHDGTSQATGFGIMERVSGNAQDGVYEQSLTIKQGSAPGRWDVMITGLSDEVGNSDLGFHDLDVVFTRYEQVAVPIAPNFIDEDGTENDAVVIPDPDGVAYNVDGEFIEPGIHPASGAIVVSARPTEEYIFPEDADIQWDHEFDPTILAAPEPVTFSDPSGMEDDTFTVPKTVGVSYFINDDEAAAGSYEGVGTVNVQARADEGYRLDSEAVNEWTHEFNADEVFVAPAVPAITGEAEVARTLTAVAGSWSPEGVELTYQWNADGDPIEDATRNTLDLTAEHVGKAITVTVTGTKDGYASATTTSSPTAAVAPGALTASVPVVTGTPVTGQTLTATPGTWGPAGVVLSYQWNADGTPITGATGTTLDLTADHVGKAITVTVTGTQDGYTTASRDSAPTAKITAPEVPVEPEEPVTPVTFKDVTEKSWFFAPVTWMVEREITTGYSDGTFKPYKPVTRGEVVTFLYRYADEDFTAPKNIDLKDVPPTHNFYEAISWATSNGVVNGYKDKTFRSSKNMTRAEVAAVLYRQADPEHTAPAESPFKDLTPESNQYEAITWLAQHKITTGRADDTFDPGANVTRAEIAAFLDRYNTVLTQ